MEKKDCRILFSVIIYFALIGNLASQNTTARFLLWHPSARSIALGGSGTALIDNDFSVFYNPAGMAYEKRIKLFSSYGQPFPFFKNTQYAFSGMTVGTRIGTIGIAINQYWRESQQRTGQFGELLGGFGENYGIMNPLHWKGSLSFAALIKPNTAIGLNINLLHMELAKIGAGSEKNQGINNSIIFDCGFIINRILPFSTILLALLGAFLNLYVSSTPNVLGLRILAMSKYLNS